jgi:hypothetical protein
MSKGTQVYSIRLPRDLVEDVECQLAMSAVWRRAAPWTLSDFVRISLREKLEKMRRSRSGRRRPGSITDVCQEQDRLASVDVIQ